MALHYKFKSTKDYSTVTFEGGFISVGDLRRSIIQQQRLTKVQDSIQLVITNAQTGEEYEEASTLIPRNTSVIVKRLPATRTNYAPYLARQQEEASIIAEPVRQTTKGVKEEERILDIVNKASGWQQTSVGQRYSSYSRGPRNQEARVPPPEYICHRCNQPGHYIINCPTNGDPAYDYRKVKKATGIPRAFLKTVDGGQGAGALLLPGGGYAVMTPNTAAFERYNQTLGVNFQPSGNAGDGRGGKRIQSFDAEGAASNVGKKRMRSGRSDITCFSCGENGHMARECPNSRNKPQYRDRGQRQQSTRSDGPGEMYAVQLTGGAPNDQNNKRQRT
eukprot:TRINITY_DN20679_c0_g1_i1.p1 TRINITY_DN20679_c0_g1~~TRINITY_DN20679_c0_g1_i1.p1  ORF type:complete len:333 (+),score=59.68 TRINITY_DN20679_c0_g1_i1:325-1323(+)